MQRFKIVLFRSCFLCFAGVEIPFFFPSSLCVWTTTPHTPLKKLGLRWLLVLILPGAISVPFFTCCQAAFFCVCVCVFLRPAVFSSEVISAVHSLCISVTLWAPSISVRGGTASQSKPTVLSLNICSLLSAMRKSLFSLHVEVKMEGLSENRLC